VDDTRNEIPTLSNKTVEVNIAKPKVEQADTRLETAQVPSVDQPKIDKADVKPLQSESQAANVLIESKEQLEGLVQDADLDFIIEELTTKQPPSSKK